MAFRRWVETAALGIGLALAATTAYAFQTIKVGSSGATVYANPQSDAAEVGILPAGSVVNVSDQSSNGFYRATGRNGLSGWVRAEALSLPSKGAEAPLVAGAKPADSIKAPEPPFSPTPTQSRFSLGVLGGAGIAGGGTSIAVGGELEYKVHPSIGLGAYFEYLGLASIATLTTGSGPSTVGGGGGASLMLFAAQLDYHFPDLPDLHAGIQGGLGVSSAAAINTVTVNGTTFTSANATSSSSSTAIAGGANLGYDFHLLPMVAFGIESNVFFIGGNVATTVVNVLGAIRITP